MLQLRQIIEGLKSSISISYNFAASMGSDSDSQKKIGQSFSRRLIAPLLLLVVIFFGSAIIMLTKFGGGGGSLRNSLTEEQEQGIGRDDASKGDTASNGIFAYSVPDIEGEEEVPLKKFKGAKALLIVNTASH